MKTVGVVVDQRGRWPGGAPRRVKSAKMICDGDPACLDVRVTTRGSIRLRPALSLHRNRQARWIRPRSVQQLTITMWKVLNSSTGNSITCVRIPSSGNLYGDVDPVHATDDK